MFLKGEWNVILLFSSSLQNYRPEVRVRGRESFDLWEAVITIWGIGFQLMVKDSKPSCYESWLWEESRSRFL